MDSQRIILESAPAYIILCAVVALGIAILLYRTKNPWSKTWNRILTAIRFVLVFALLFLLLGPIIKQINNIFEKPVVVVLYDNSASVKEKTDSARLIALQKQLSETEEALEELDYEVASKNLYGDNAVDLKFNADKTDLNGALKTVAQQYEGKNIAAVVLPSDGIFNAGLSPLYGNFNFPVYTVGLGDTVEHADVGIRNVSYNRIAYQGNKFPVRVEVQIKNLNNQAINVSLLHRGKVLETQSKKSNNNQLITFDFQPSADEQGIQKLDIQVAPKPGEINVRNNNSSIFVEVVEGKKKILLVAASPHPDIKPLREVVEQNSNYDFVLYIPGVEEEAMKTLKPDQVDLVIFHQSPDVRGRTQSIFQQYVKTRASLLLILGQQTDLRALAQYNMPLKFESLPREYDQVTPVTNPSFSNFAISPETATLLTEFPPVSVHFGRIRTPLSATPLLFQKVGSIATEKPLLAVDNQDGRKIGLMLGEGLWRWRLNEYDRTEKTEGFDELFGKLIQFLSTTEDKRKFKSYPIQQSFSDAEPATFESQVYNDIFEPVYGNKIEIEVTGDKGAKTNYSYVTSAGNTRYEIGGLKEGVYKYISSTVINNKREEIRGEFAVVAREAELQNLTADFGLLRKLSANTGGRFYHASQLQQLKNDLTQTQAKAVIHSEESFNNLVNLKSVFWLFVLLISVEWFARKYFGSY